MCVYAISGGTGAHMADMLVGRGPAAPDAHEGDAAALHDGLIPAYLRVSNPVDCGGPPVADARGRKILDAILADKNVDIVVIPITGAVAMFSDPFTRDIIEVGEDHRQADLRRSGARRPGTDDTYYKRLLDGGLPVFRTFGNCVDGGEGATPTTGRSRRGTARRSRRAPTAPVAGGEEGAQAARRPRAGRGAVGVGLEAAAARRTASRRRTTSSCTSAAEAVQGREARSASRS